MLWEVYTGAMTCSGGERGTLGKLTKAVTYGLFAGFGFGVPLGKWFGLIGRLVLGPSLAVEFSTRRHGTPPLESALFLVLGASPSGSLAHCP
jgi:hypothetical protein